MVEVTAQVRQWGRSVGIVIPKETAVKARLKPGDEVRVSIMKKNNPLKELFGITKFSRPIGKILKEVDREAWNE